MPRSAFVNSAAIPAAESSRGDGFTDVDVEVKLEVKLEVNEAEAAPEATVAVCGEVEREDVQPLRAPSPNSALTMNFTRRFCSFARRCGRDSA